MILRSEKNTKTMNEDQHRNVYTNRIRQEEP
jgi:hypothetical protein